MNIREVLTDLNIRYWEHSQHHHVSIGWLGIDCWQCTPGSGRCRLGINLRNLVANCYACGKVRLAEALAGASGRHIAEIIKLLPGMARERPDRAETPTGRYLLPAGTGPLERAHRAFLERRGLDPDQVCQVWGVLGTGMGSSVGWRLVLPVPDRTGKPVSWTTRALGNAEPRYLSAAPDQEATPLKSLLYGEHLAGHAVCICEGPLDAITIGVGAVATFGAAVTEAQIAKMACYPVRLICFDSDAAGRRAGERLARELTVFPGTTSVLRLSGAKDPGSASEADLEEIRKIIRG